MPRILQVADHCHALSSTGLQTPFLLLPFRPASDASAARTFIRNYFNQAQAKGSPPKGDALAQELRLTDPILARDAFSTFIPISVDSDARSKIIFDFFDLLTAIAAHGKSNGLGGRKLSRYAGWWAFEHTDTGNGFEAAYKDWASAADATSHLFFAYLRSLSPDSPRGMSSISTLPIALQTLLQATEYPPETPALLQVSTTKVVMIVDTVSATPFALLRRAKNFEYRDSDSHLQKFASFEDPLQALTDECLRVLKCISSTNQSVESDPTSATREASWSRFEDLGFGATDVDDDRTSSMVSKEFGGGLRSVPQSGGGDLGRPTTPSWADFMSSGFSDDNVFKGPVAPVLLPPDKVLPPINTIRGQSSQSHKRTLNTEPSVDPGELASITTLDLDDSFWWVWISSLAGEEPASRKAVFGRCALLETVIKNTKWLVLEEQVKGAAPEPEPGAYIVEKKGFFGFSTRKRLGRRKSLAKKVSAVEESYKRPDNQGPQSKTSIGPDQHARIQAAAAALQRKHREQEEAASAQSRNNIRDTTYSKTNSVMTLQPAILNEASHALKWASNYDKGKNAYKAAYMENSLAGTGAPVDEVKEASRENLSPPLSPALSTSTRQAPPPLPKDDVRSSPAPATPQKDSFTGDRDASGRKDSSSAPVEQSATEPLRKSTDLAEDPSNKLKKKPPTMGIKSMFGTTKRKPEPEARPPMKSTGAGGSAVAAARAALEDKAKASQEPVVRPSTLKKKPVPGVSTAETPKPVVEAPATPKPVTETPKPEQPEAKIQQEARVQPEPHVSASNSDYHSSQRQAEYDALSRVNTNERTTADSEFSRFDQGPLVEQPAFVPEDSPVSDTFSEKEPVDSAPAEAKDEVSPPSQANPSHDRWAQIRKNAAERAAQFEHMRMNEDDGGNTSEEESFDARAARIKARVAELTGKMA
ncbi:hypothetical protein APSETT445_007639 [Aspergillus pseudonomiae]